jgi:hypothetical protein
VSLPITLRITRGAAPPPEPEPPEGNWDLAANRPSASWTLVTDWLMDTQTNSPTTDVWEIYLDPVTGQMWQVAMNRSGATPTIIDDATAPSGAGRCIQMSWNGVTDGGDVKFPFIDWSSGQNRMFAAWTVKLASTWVQPTSSGQKMYIVSSNGSSPMNGWLGSIGTFSPGQNPAFGFQSGACASGTCSDPISGVEFTVGEWHKYQLYMSKDPGIIRVWLDDVMIIDRTGFSWSTAAGTNFNGLTLGGTWGGGTNRNPGAGDIQYFDRAAIWRAP